MEIEAFEQGDAVSSCGYTVNGLCGWQIRHLYSSQQHHPSDGKPAPKSGMYAHTCYVLGPPRVRLHVLSLVVVSSPCYMGRCLGQDLGAPVGVYLVVSDDFYLQLWEALSNSAQVIGHTLVHRVSQWLEVAALQEGLEGPVKHGRCAEYQEGQCRSWQGQVEGWRQECIVPCHLEGVNFEAKRAQRVLNLLLQLCD